MPEKEPKGVTWISGATNSSMKVVFISYTKMRHKNRYLKRRWSTNLEGWRYRIRMINKRL